MTYFARSTPTVVISFIESPFAGFRLPVAQTVSLIDTFTFESRSHSGHSDSDYQLCRTKCCGRYGVKDDELLDFYFDPADLSRHIFMEKGTPCPFCKEPDCSYVQIDDFAAMPAEWRWAAPRDLRERV